MLLIEKELAMEVSNNIETEQIKSRMDTYIPGELQATAMAKLFEIQFKRKPLYEQSAVNVLSWMEKEVEIPYQEEIWQYYMKQAVDVCWQYDTKTPIWSMIFMNKISQELRIVYTDDDFLLKILIVESDNRVDVDVPGQLQTVAKVNLTCISSDHSQLVVACTRVVNALWETEWTVFEWEVDSWVLHKTNVARFCATTITHSAKRQILMSDLNTIIKYTQDGHMLWKRMLDIEISDMAVDTFETIWICDSKNNQLLRYDMNGTQTASIELEVPAAVSVSETGMWLIVGHMADTGSVVSLISRAGHTRKILLKCCGPVRAMALYKNSYLAIATVDGITLYDVSLLLTSISPGQKKI